MTWCWMTAARYSLPILLQRYYQRRIHSRIIDGGILAWRNHIPICTGICCSINFQPLVCRSFITNSHSIIGIKKMNIPRSVRSNLHRQSDVFARYPAISRFVNSLHTPDAQVSTSNICSISIDGFYPPYQSAFGFGDSITRPGCASIGCSSNNHL